jgi:hypothetical protein
VPDADTTIADALTAIGHPGLASSRRPVLHRGDATLVTLAALAADGSPTWRGLWLDPSGARVLGPPAPPSLLTQTGHLPSPTAELLDLLEAAYRSYVDWLEVLGGRLDTLEGRPDPAPLAELGALLHAIAGVRKHIERWTVLVTDLGGPLGSLFPAIAGQLPVLRSESMHLDSLSGGIGQGVRDLVSIRNAVESNRLAESANRLGEVSNRIAALANTSNLRMLGVAYIALVLALISAVVLIPNTAATILGVPGAAWVPGIWIVVILVVLAVVPVAIVFSRPWVIRTLRALSTSEVRSGEGLRDLPEVRAQDIETDAPLLRQGS